MVGACNKALADGINALKIPLAIDVDCTAKYAVYGVNIAKTLTKTRGGQGGPWISSRGRRTTTTELMKIQGFEDGEIRWEEAGLSAREVGKLLGNAVAVPVLGCILQEALYCAGIVDKKPTFPMCRLARPQAVPAFEGA